MGNFMYSGGNENGMATLDNILAVSKSVKHKFAIQPGR